MYTNELVINVNEDFNIHNISSKDTEIWQKICDKLDTLGTSKRIILDFKGILLTDAWKNTYFTNVLKMPNVILKLYHSSEMAADVNQICQLCGFGDDRVINIGTVTQVDSKPKETVKRRIVDKIKAKSLVTGTDLVIQYAQALHSLEKTEVIYAIQVALDETLAQNPGVKSITIDFEDAVITTSVMDCLVETFKDYYSKYVFEFKTTVYQKDLKMHMLKYKGLNAELKEQVLLKELPANAAVLLVKYITSKNKNNLGCVGDGKVDWCHVAIFKGIQDKKVLFDHYNVKDFHTKEHKRIAQVTVEPPETKRIAIPIEELGFWEEFLGVTYHCNHLVQFSMDESCMEWVTEDGENVQKVYTIPEFVKIVCDEYGIEYDAALLDDAIESTRQVLELA